ncbi:hypothetical protein D3C72_644650 [compost metagenome]
MMEMELLTGNCPNCGSVYKKNLRNLCTTCSAKLDSELTQCLDLLWRSPNTSTDELSLATNIKKSVIIQFIKEGRLPKNCKNLTYPCECCGTSIRHNRLCLGCSVSFSEVAEQLNPKFVITQGKGFMMNRRLNEQT